MATIKELILKFSKTASSNSFLQHVDYFKEQGKITTTSIANKWSALSGESEWVTTPRGVAVITGANYSDERKGCPFKFEYNAKELMLCLKHPKDTGIVNADGSINLDIMENMMTEYFKFDADKKRYVMTKESMFDFLKKCDERDKDYKYGAFYVTWESVAKNEWDSFFDNFTDFVDEQTNEPTIYAETFLLFYFNSDQLYKTKLDYNKL